MESEKTCDLLRLACAYLLESNDIGVSVNENCGNAITPDAKVETFA